MAPTALSGVEMGVQATAVVLSNLAMLPAIVLLWRGGKRYEAVLGTGAFVSSTGYHLAQTFASNLLGYNEGDWHRIDNITSINCFIAVFVYLMDNRTRGVSTLLKTVGFLAVLRMQLTRPWYLPYTVGPVALAVALPLCKHCLVARRFPRRFRVDMLRKGGLFLLLAFVAFARGLDDEADYLKLAHGAWHFLISVASYYMWQIVDEDKDEGEDGEGGLWRQGRARRPHAFALDKLV